MVLGEMFVPDSPLVGRVVPSPNGRARVGEERVRWVVLHGTWMADDAAAMARLCDSVAEVSCHYYVDRAGEIFQMVPETMVAWHAGRSQWKGVENLNGWTLGIEIGNNGTELYGEAQYACVVALLKDILARYGLGPEAVVGHEEIAPGRKTDPGHHFDWGRLARAGVALPRPLVG